MKKEISSHVKALILEKGFRIDEHALTGLGTRFKEEHRGYDDSNWGISSDLIVPSELLLPGDIVVCTHLRPSSPHIVKYGDDGKLHFFENGIDPISIVNYLPRPKVWANQLADGSDIKKIINFYGFDTLNINIYSGCEFWDVGLPCKFCSVSPTQEKYHEVFVKKDESQIREAVSKSFKSGDKINFVLTTGGSTVNPNEEFEAHIRALHIIREYAPWNHKIRGNTALMPPIELKRLAELYETGMEHPSFNLEVWGKDRFADVCPGKQKYRGYDTILEAYRYSVKELYGEGALWCNFVGGINSLEDLKEGFTEMANMGVVPGANIFHPDRGAIFGRKLKSPPYDYIINLYRHASDIYHEKGYKPFFSESSLRNSLANEAYKGWI
ncbi:MAG: radical SAM protein [Candidatus Woesearchaeota archaeon]